MFLPRAVLIISMMSVFSICGAGTPAPVYPPSPSDPKLAAVFEEAKILVSKAQSSGYMDMPSTAQAWPCEVSDFQLRKIAWVLNDDEMDARTKLAFRKSALNAGMSSKDMKMRFRDASFAPLVATCKNGLLDGPLELFVEYTRIMDSTASTMDLRMRVRQSMTVAAGEPVEQAPRFTIVMTLSSKLTYKDPAVQAAMAKIKMPDAKTITVSYMLPINADDFYMAGISEVSGASWMTMLTRPTGPNRSEMTSYMGEKVFSVMPMKSRLPHGEQRMAEQKYGDMVVPAKSICYEEGEIILTTQCDVQ